jgi:hypothetical protein
MKSFCLLAVYTICILMLLSCWPGMYYQQLHLKYICDLARHWLQAPWGRHESVETGRSVIFCEIICIWSVIVQNKCECLLTNCCVPTARLYLASRQVICAWTVRTIRHVEWPSTRIVGTLSHWPVVRVCELFTRLLVQCTAIGAFVTYTSRGNRMIWIIRTFGYIFNSTVSDWGGNVELYGCEWMMKGFARKRSRPDLSCSAIYVEWLRKVMKDLRIKRIILKPGPPDYKAGEMPTAFLRRHRFLSCPAVLHINSSLAQNNAKINVTTGSLSSCSNV